MRFYGIFYTYVSGHNCTEERCIQTGGKFQSQTNKVETCYNQERLDNMTFLSWIYMIWLCFC